MKARDRFEAYMIAAGVNEGFLARSTSRPGHYVDFVVNVEWSAWQAAEAETARRCDEIVRRWMIGPMERAQWATCAEIGQAIKKEYPEAFK